MFKAKFARDLKKLSSWLQGYSSIRLRESLISSQADYKDNKRTHKGCLQYPSRKYPGYGRMSSGYTRVPKNSIHGCNTYRSRCCCFNDLVLTVNSVVVQPIIPDSTTWSRRSNGNLHKMWLSHVLITANTTTVWQQLKDWSARVESACFERISVPL